LAFAFHAAPITSLNLTQRSFVPILFQLIRTGGAKLLIAGRRVWIGLCPEEDEREHRDGQKRKNNYLARRLEGEGVSHPQNSMIKICGSEK
jgi:hypothetical protein